MQDTTTMLGSAAGKPVELKEVALRESESVSQLAAQAATRKIWLPKFLYDALPYFYLLAGMLAFAATVYISEWFWILPHYLLFSAACVHLGVIVLRRRQTSDNPAS